MGHKGRRIEMAMNRTPFILQSVQRAIVLLRQTNRRQRAFTRRKVPSVIRISRSTPEIRRELARIFFFNLPGQRSYSFDFIFPLRTKRTCVSFLIFHPFQCEHLSVRCQFSDVESQLNSRNYIQSYRWSVDEIYRLDALLSSDAF